MGCRRWIVSGRVQGVYYRGSTQQQARRLGVDGSARNRVDGTVEVIGCGPDRQLDQLERWLWRGSEWAEVSGVVGEEVELSVTPGFSTG